MRSCSPGLTARRLPGWRAVYKATTPDLEPAETRGSGDSMTAGLAAGVSRGLDPVEILKLACAAGRQTSQRMAWEAPQTT